MATKKQQQRRYKRRTMHCTGLKQRQKSHKAERSRRLLWVIENIGDHLTKHQLVHQADTLGVDVKLSWKKDQIISEITDAVMAGKVAV